MNVFSIEVNGSSIEISYYVNMIITICKWSEILII